MGKRALAALFALLALSVLGAGASLAGCGGGSDSDSESDIDQPAFSEPPRIPVKNGVTLRAEETEFVAGGQTVKGRSYNGEFIGPTLVINRGEAVYLTLENALAEETTNLHYHGFHVTPKPPSDQVITTMIQPGGTYHYKVPIPAKHDQGTFWYHSHNHGTSEGQVFGGLSGVALIGTPQVKFSEDRVLALKDFQVGDDGEIPREGIDSDATTTRTVNGLLEPQIDLVPQAWELWRLANISADIFYDVELEGQKLYVVNQDGNPVEQIWAAKDLVLPPGKRFDVLVMVYKPGTYLLKTLKYKTGPTGDEYPEKTLATVAVGGEPAEEKIPLSEQERLVEQNGRALPQPTKERTKILTERETPTESVFMINGRTFNPNRIDDTVKLNTVEDWTFKNETEEQHPIHIHQDDFWVIAENNQQIIPNGQQDTVIVPPGGSVKLRIPFTDFEGEFVYHCHILNHEDNGMMATINVNATGEEQAASAGPAHDHSSHSH